MIDNGQQENQSRAVYLRSSAASIRSSPADSMVCCQEFVDPGMTNPKSKNHSAGEKESAVLSDIDGRDDRMHSPCPDHSRQNLGCARKFEGLRQARCVLR